jgi:hypothetical protein
MERAAELAGTSPLPSQDGRSGVAGDLVDMDRPGPVSARYGPASRHAGRHRWEARAEALDLHVGTDGGNQAPEIKPRIYRSQLAFIGSESEGAISPQTLTLQGIAGLSVSQRNR